MSGDSFRSQGKNPFFSIALMPLTFQQRIFIGKLLSFSKTVNRYFFFPLYGFELDVMRCVGGVRCRTHRSHRYQARFVVLL